MKNYPLALSSWGDEEISAIHEVIESDNYSMGSKVYAFEKAFAEFLGVPYCVMVNSGSSANLLGVGALMYRSQNPLKPGDEVIVPAVSWSTTYFPLHQYGLKLKFVDIDKDTLNIDLDSLNEAISEKTKVIVLVNLLGNPNHFDKIQDIVKGRDVYLFEDNCESLGAEYNNKQAGTFSEVGTFSCFFSHHISTMEGGIVAVKDEETYHILLSLRAHGWTRNLPEKNRLTGEKDKNPFYESFKFILPGYNVRPIEMSGAIGLCQLKKLPNFIAERRCNADLFVKKVSNVKGYRTQKEVGKSSWFGFAIILEEHLSGKRDELVEFLSQSGVETRPIVGGNFLRNPVVKFLNFEVAGSLNNADEISDNGLFVGNHHVSMKNAIDLLVSLLVEFSQKNFIKGNE